MTHGNKVYERHNITLRLQLLSLCTRRELGLYPWTPLGDYRPQTPSSPIIHPDTAVYTKASKYMAVPHAPKSA